MRTRISRLMLLALALLAASPRPLAAQERPAATPTTTPASSAVDSYLEGLDALKAGEYPRATGLFTRAVEAEDENVDYLRARGVADTLAEDFPAAITDLQRVLRLRDGDGEAKLWLAAAYRMGGEPQKGSMIFSFSRDVPNNYTDLVYNNMAMDYWSSRHNGTYYDRAQNRQVQTSSPVKKLFGEAAAGYVERHQVSGAQAAEVLGRRVKQSMARGDWRAAVAGMVTLRRSEPDNVALRAEWATCLLGSGNAAQARREFTHVLCAQPLWADGYAGRAAASAMLGDGRRADDDLRSAAALNAGGLEKIKQFVQSALAQQPPEDALAQFNQALENDGDFAAFVRQAAAVRRWNESRRRRYDEQYQDRIRAMAFVIRADPGSPDRPESLARFLYNNRVTPVVWDGPRGDGEALRAQSRSEQAAELSRGIALCDAALKLDDHHANALATRGWILYVQGDSAGAEAMADAGLATKSRNVRLLGLKAQTLSDQARALDSAAAALQLGHDETRTENRGDRIVEIHTHYGPTAQQVAQAQALMTQAADLHAAARRLLDDAGRVKTEVLPALLKQGDAAAAAGDAVGSRQAFEQAYALDADLVDLYPRLAQAYRTKGDTGWAEVFALLAEPLHHTSAADELHGAWDAVVRTAWNSASALLDKAAAIDPADARIPAYRAVIAAARSPADTNAARSARRQQCAALALEETRANQMGTSFLRPDPARADLIGPEDVALTTIVRRQLGESYLSAGDAGKALAEFAANVSLEKRLGKTRFVEEVPLAMLPDPTIDPHTIPVAPTVGSLLAYSRLGAGRALLALGRPDEAKQEFEAVRDYQATWPATAEHRETLYVPDTWARLGLAQAAYAAKDIETAFRLMNGDGIPGDLPQELQKEFRDFSEKVSAARMKGWDDEARKPVGPPSRSARQTTYYQSQIESLTAVRAALSERLNDPSLLAGQKPFLERQLADVDRRIADAKQKVADLERAQGEGHSGGR